MLEYQALVVMEVLAEAQSSTGPLAEDPLVVVVVVVVVAAASQ